MYVFLPIANGMINKPTNISLTAKLTISIFDAVRNFLTRQTANITKRFPTTVIIINNGQTIRTITKRKVLADSFCVNLSVLFIKWLSSLLIGVVIENDFGIIVVDNIEIGVVDNIRRRTVLNTCDEPLVYVLEDENDGFRCWAAAVTDDNNENKDNNERNMDVRLE